MLEFNAYKKLFAALLALPNLAGAFSSTSLLFLPGALWNKDQRLVSSMGQDATAITWAVACTSNPIATSTCDIPSPYLLYTIGPSTMHASNTLAAPNFDITCALTPSLVALCSGHVTGIPWATAMNANFLFSYGYRAVTITDAFPASTPARFPPTAHPTTTGPSTSKTSISITGPTGINSAILNSYGGTTTSTGRASAGDGLGGDQSGIGATGTSKTKNVAAPMVTGMIGEMGMMAAVAVVGGAVGF